MRPILLSIAFFFALAAEAGAAELLPVEINGLNAELQAYVRTAIDLPENKGKAKGVEISEGRLGYYVNNIVNLAETALEPLGYYSPEVKSRLQRNGTQVKIILDITLGPFVAVRQKAVVVEGAASKDRVIGFWLEGFEPEVGDPFNHGLYEDNKALINQALYDRGYFDQQNTRHEVRVTRAEQAADVDLQWQSGVRYRYGPVRFEGNHLRPGLLDKLVNFEQGNPYSQPQINRLQESLTKLDYFNGIEIVPDLENKRDGEVPIVVTVTQGKRTSQSASVRYGTKTGLGVEYGLERRWLNDRGHKLDITTAFAQNEQSLTTLYRIPAFIWLDGWYGIGMTARNEEYTASNSRYAELFVNRSGQIRNWDLLASVNLRRERFDEFIPDINQDNPINLYTAVLYPEFNATWRKADDPTYPTSGSAWLYQVRTGYEFESSDAAFIQASVKHKRIIGLNDGHRLLVRAEAGAIWSRNYTLFPPSLRFYAGGDQSVRGYSFKEIGEYLGEVNFGGRYLLLGSVEYERKLNAEWAVATFLDVGDAFERTPQANFGLGAGARWRSPIGPVRLDVAYGFNGPKPGVGIHFAIGSEL
jgi:translocation and assembly module TamA